MPPSAETSSTSIFLRSHFGNGQLATAAAQVSQRVMTLRDDFDEELVMELTDAHLATSGVYDEFIIRKRDRLQIASGAIRSARSQALRELRHSMRAALAWEMDMLPPTYRPNRLFVGSDLDFTFGLAYETTPTLVHMATTSGRDPDDVITQYRAEVAGECPHPPGVAVRMPSVASVKRFSVAIDSGTFDLPVQIQFEGDDMQGWVPVTQHGPQWSVTGLGMRKGNDARVSEAGRALLEHRTPTTALDTGEGLRDRHRDRIQKEGTATEVVAGSSFISGAAFDKSNGTLTLSMSDFLPVPVPIRHRSVMTTFRTRSVPRTGTSGSDL